MKRLLFTATAIAALSVTQIAAAQAPVPLGNNPTTAGLYMGLGLGVSVLDDVDSDTDGIELTSEADVGFFGDVSLGYIIPFGSFNVRTEGEFAVRVNGVDNVEIDGIDADFEALDESDFSSLAGMANAYLDFYILPNTALTAGAGIGYATVQADLAAEIGGVDVLLFDEESDSSFAYQGMLGARYDFAGGSTIDVGYTYFAVNDLTIDDAAGDETDFDYLSHSFHIGYAYRF